MQISSAGKTTSLGDHDTEADAARAFDRALINKLGGQAKTTNFPISDYDSEIEDLTGATWCKDACHLHHHLSSSLLTDGQDCSPDGDAD